MTSAPLAKTGMPLTTSSKERPHLVEMAIEHDGAQAGLDVALIGATARLR